MKKLLVVFVVASTMCLSTRGQSCMCNYIYSGANDTIAFTNLSSFSNAHYYWSFGDGTGSNAVNPIHVFPESGKYLVILYAKDTVSSCHNHYELWITINKPTSDSCHALISDSIFSNMGSDYLLVIDSSDHCGSYYSNIDAATARNFQHGWLIGLSGGWGHALFLSRIQFYTVDSFSNIIVHREYYKTTPYKFSNVLNYDSCSANFEFTIDYQTSGATVYFTAMNQHATSYDFIIDGFGSPIHYYSSTGSHFYPYHNYEKYEMYSIWLSTNDSSGCRDTVTQQLLIFNPYYGAMGVNEIENHSLNLSVYPNPTSGVFTVEMELKKNSSFNINIYDLLGKLVYESRNPKQQGKISKRINLSDLAEGMYVFSVQTDQGIATTKLIKQ